MNTQGQAGENLFGKTAKVVKKRYFYYLGRGVSKILP